MRFKGDVGVNAHQAQDLKIMQSLPLEIKIDMTKRRIQEWYEHWDGMVYVSFSGGKDSTVLKHIVDSMYDDVPSLFVNTGLEYPEIQKFAMSQKNVVTVRPEMRFDEVIKKYGYPVISKSVSRTIHYARLDISQGKQSIYTKQLNGNALDRQGRISLYNKKKWAFLLDAPFDMHSACCDVMKKKPIRAYQTETGRKPYVGTLAAESMNRQVQWLRNGCNAFDGEKARSAPLSFWTEQDILHYLKKYNVPYCSVYGDIVSQDADGNEYDLPYEHYKMIRDLGGQIDLKTTGCDRTGCIFCMFGCHLEKEPNRFQRLKQTHPRQYQYCIGGGEMVDGKWQPSKDGLGLGHVLDYIGVKYE
jgi:3'-phosphoadenosine 5'-phosphosulfate sulfotransferase (PAPS reductase)/FAD synthetase